MERHPDPDLTVGSMDAMKDKTKEWKDPEGGGVLRPRHSLRATFPYKGLMALLGT